MVRAFLEGLPASGGPREVERVRFFLEALQRPDVRYLVAFVVGGSAGAIARVSEAVLEAAGAPTGRSEHGAAWLRGAAMDEPLFAAAGTLAAAATYQVGASRPDLGEPGRREVEAALAYTAFAEASMRVVLIVERTVGSPGGWQAARPDLVVLGRLARTETDAALALAAEDTPVVAAPQEPAVRARIEERAHARGAPLALAERDFSHEDRGGLTDVRVAGVAYAGLPRGRLAGWELATGVVGALGLSAMGIRMRDEWVRAGAAAATMEP